MITSHNSFFRIIIVGFALDYIFCRIEKRPGWPTKKDCVHCSTTAQVWMARMPGNTKFVFVCDELCSFSQTKNDIWLSRTDAEQIFPYGRFPERFLEFRLALVKHRRSTGELHPDEEYLLEKDGCEILFGKA